MSCWTNKNLKNYAVTTKLENIANKANKENIYDFGKPETKYLYVNPIYYKSPLENYNAKRLEGGDYQQEAYFDCHSSSCKEDDKDEPLKTQHIRMYDVLKEIENPKQFKRALKQLIFNSHILYDTFHQAYYKAKKAHKTSTKNPGVKCKYCFERVGEKNYQQKMDRGDINKFQKSCDENKSKNLNKKGPFDVKHENPNKTGPSDIKQEKLNKTGPSDIKQENLNKTGPSDVKHENLNRTGPSYVKPEKEYCNATASCSNVGAVIHQICGCNRLDYPSVKQTNAENQTTDYSVHLQNEQTVDKLQDKDTDVYDKRNSIIKRKMPDSENVQKKSPDTTQQYQADKYTCVLTATMNNTEEQEQVKETITPICLTIPVNLEIGSDRENIRFIDRGTVSQSVDSKETQTIVQPLTTRVPPVSLNKLRRDSQGVSSNTKKPETQARQPLEENPETPMDFNIKIKKELKRDARLDELKRKSDHLRSELVHEIKLVLEQTLPTAAIHALKRGDRLSRYNDTEQSEPTEAIPVIQRREGFSVASDIKEIEPEATQALQREYDVETNTKTDTTGDKMFSPSKYEARQLNFSQPQLPPADVKSENESTVFTSEPVSTESNVAIGVQTTVSALKPFGHYKRNEMRREIQEHLKQLIRHNDSYTKEIYSTAERRDILLELHKLFHPVKSDLLANDLKLRNILNDVRYVLNPNLPTDNKILNLPASEEIIIESVRYIINSKAQLRDKTKIRKCETEIKHKILENFLTFLKPSKQNTAAADKITRNNAILEIRLLLDTCVEKSSKLAQQKVGILPNNSTKEQLEKLADLRYTEDATSSSKLRTLEKPENQIKTKKRSSKAKRKLSTANPSFE